MKTTSPIGPPLFADRPRRRSPIQVSMTPEEREAVRREAERTGVSTSSYVRLAIAAAMLQADSEHEAAA